ncbi:hypothetical protein [Planctomonas deserti]|uniref:hypothetical protein n=1 Tax=Planctomonas deserti TaxID=2144185 RepID=UPI00131ED80D|nr:hypothetical protein [Planctomonas deserti]
MSASLDERIIYDVFALAELDDPRYSVLREAVIARLEAFECARSEHLQHFARENVHKYENHGHSRTYVLITPSDDEGIDVPAFFTVGMTVLDLSQASNSKRKKLSGGISLDATGAYSIAELARSDRYSRSQLPGSVILDEAKQVIASARLHVGGRFVVVDCRREVFQQLYEPAGFREIHVAQPPAGMESASFLTACCLARDLMA